MGDAFGVVEQVQIEQLDDKTVTFSTRSGSKSGNPDECLRRSFTCPLSEVWSQPIEGAPPPVAMSPGAVGNLFLSRAGWATTSGDGYPIYGAGTPIERIKYPDNAAGSQLVGALTVIPSSIVVHGTVKGGSEFVDVELIGPDVGDAQHIVWNGAEHLTLRLSQAGAQRFQLAGHARTVEIWPTRITVTGAPASEPDISGVVDLLDTERAALQQEFRFAKHRAPISLMLTQDGFAAFHVVPGTTDEKPRRRASHRS